MLKLSKQSDYGLVLMTVLASLPPNTYAGLKELATEHNLPYKFIGQIATKLKKAQLLSSKEGSGGGYQLAKPASQITINQIITALEGPLTPTSCMRGDTCRCAGSCQHQYLIADLTKVLIKAMDNHTLADIISHSK